MIANIYFILTLIFFVSFFFVKRETKLIILLIPFILCDNIIPFLPVPIISTVRNTFILGFLLSEIKYIKKSFKYFPLKNTLYAIFFSSLLIAINSEYLPGAQKIIRPTWGIIGLIYGVFLYSYMISNQYSFYKIQKKVFLLLSILTLVGTINYILKDNIILTQIYSNFNLQSNMSDNIGTLFQNRDRFRVSSLFTNPFDYGFINLILFLYYMYIYISKQYSNKYLVLSALIMGAWAVIFCGCRSVLLTLIISIIIFLFYNYRLRKLSKYIFSSIILFIILYLSIPFLKEITDAIISLFNSQDGSTVQGSSIGMRLTQLYGSIEYFNQSPLLGNGFEYINKGLGWQDFDQSKMNTDMYGFESIIFVLLIERGLIGIIAYIYFAIKVYEYINKKKNIDRTCAAFGFSVFSAYLIFSILTGELLSLPITLFFLGITIKHLDIKSKLLNTTIKNGNNRCISNHRKL